MKNRLRDAIQSSRADFTEIRLERSVTSAVTFRGPRLEGATVSTDEGGFVRCLNRGYGWGMASFTSLDNLPAMVARAHELSLAVRLDAPIRLADAPVREDDVVLPLGGDVRGISLDVKKGHLESLNALMLVARSPDHRHAGRLSRRGGGILVRQFRWDHALRASTGGDPLRRRRGP